jgi:hypothetical protein
LEGVVESAPAFCDGVNCEGEKASIWLENIMAGSLLVWDGLLSDRIGWISSSSGGFGGWRRWIGDRNLVCGVRTREYEEEEWKGKKNGGRFGRSARKMNPASRQF